MPPRRHARRLAPNVFDDTLGPVEADGQAMRVVLKIRTAPEKQVNRARKPNRRLAYLAAHLLWPIAFFCFVACLWRWSYDLSWIDRFFVTQGILFHWQVWFLAGMVLQAAAVWLSRYAQPDHAPRRHTRVTVRPQQTRQLQIP
jgi:hypothetical protein